MKSLLSKILILDQILFETVRSISPPYDITPIITAPQKGLVLSLGIQPRATPALIGFEILQSL